VESYSSKDIETRLGEEGEGGRREVVGGREREESLVQALHTTNYIDDIRTSTISCKLSTTFLA